MTMLGVESGGADAVASAATRTKDETAISGNDNDHAKEEKDEENPSPADASQEAPLVAPEDVALAAALGGPLDDNNNVVDVLAATDTGIEVQAQEEADEQDPEAPATSPSNESPRVNPVVAKAKEVHETQIRPALQKAGASVRQVHQATVQGAQKIKENVGNKSRELSLGANMALAAATAQTAHTLNQIGSNPLEAAGSTEEGEEDVAGHRVKGERSDGWITGFHAYGIQGLSVVGFLSALTSMIIVVGHLVDFSSLFTLVLSPLVFWQKTKLKELGGMRGQQNELRNHVNQLTSENTKLTSSIDSMEEQVEKLKHVEDELDGIAKTAGGQVDRLVNIVHENGQIQKEIKDILDDEIMQQIITAVINTDRDGDYKLSKREVRQLEYRLKNIPGVIFNHDRFQEFVASDEGDLTLTDVVTIARNIQDPSIPDEKRIFRYTPKQIKDAKKQKDTEAESAANSAQVAA